MYIPIARISTPLARKHFCALCLPNCIFYAIVMIIYLVNKDALDTINSEALNASLYIKADIGLTVIALIGHVLSILCASKRTA
jgi:hypothetical protein